MNRRCFGLTLACVLLVCTPSFADYKTASRVTPINKTADFFATVGKSPRDKKEILKERRDLRREVRLKEEARRKRTATRKKMKQQQQEIMRKINAE